MSEVFPLNDLPDLVLRNIFQFLTGQERQQVMSQCHRWRDLLQEAFFEKRVTLTISHCYISTERSPYTVFCASSRKFFSISVGEGIQMVVPEALNFWSHVGQFTETLYLDSKDIKVPQDFLTHFPALKRVKFIDTRKFFYLDVPNTVETVNLNVVQQFYLPWQMEKLTGIKTVTAEFLCFNKTLDTKVEYVSVSTELTQAVQRLHLNQAKIPPYNLNQMTEKLTFVDILSFKDKKVVMREMAGFVCDFSNLRSIYLQMNADLAQEDVGCFFVHFTISLASIENVTVMSTRLYEIQYCDECLNHLIESCPNLRGWKIHGQIKDTTSLIATSPQPLRNLILTGFLEPLVLPNSPELEELVIQAEWETTPHQLDPRNCSFMPHLRELFIGCSTRLAITELRQLIEISPNVEKAGFYTVDVEKVVHLMEKNWQNLRQIELNGPTGSEKEFPEFVSGTGFKKLREIDVNQPPVTRFSEKVTQISPAVVAVFEKIGSLRRYCSTTYAHYCDQNVKDKMKSLHYLVNKS